MTEKTASGLSPRTLRGAVERADTVPELKHVVDMAATAVEACKRTRREIEETNEYAEVALLGVVKAGQLLKDLERKPGRRTDREPRPPDAHKGAKGDDRGKGGFSF
ncbi:MAG: hypothetical protein M3P43_02355 [Actinomycetota bacterium]|nr:hypothetical protein [Actinomycetota bacterium]